MTDLERCKAHSQRIRDYEIIEAKQSEILNYLQQDITALGNTTRTAMKDMRENTDKRFDDVWTHFDNMLPKIGAMVVICTSLVMAIFRIVESTK